MSNKIDIIYDLDGVPAVRKELHEKLPASNNSRTAIASEEQIALKMENFHNNDDQQFRISSPKGMRLILQNMAAQSAQVALYYGNDQDMILTTLFGLDERGIWLEASPLPQKNTQLLLSDKVTFVGLHQQVKIQFTGDSIENDFPGEREAFYFKLPDYLLRIQRREFFRIAIPPSPPLECIISVPPENPDKPVLTCTVPITDISAGGIGLLCKETDDTLLPEKVFPDCRIAIPDIGTLIATIEVRNSTPLSLPEQAACKRIGCRFVQLNSHMDKLLHRYLTFLQSVHIHMARS